jgi:3-phenylpropionate/cinnamic acid dioxygenase small subunit
VSSETEALPAYAEALPEPALWGRCDDELEVLVYREAHLLDAALTDEWWSLFHPDALYWVPGEGPRGLDQVSLIFDDSQHLRDRIYRLERGKAASQSPPTTTTHVVSAPIGIWRPDVADDRSHVECLTNQVIHYARGERYGCLPATVQHVVDFSEGCPLIRLKKVTVLTRNQPVPDLSFFL